MGEDCVFCGIVAGERDGHFVYEDDETVAFLDVNAVAKGHTLVVPREHYRTLTDMPPEAAAATYRTVRTVAEAIEREFDPDGINAFHSSGAAAGQDVFHAHVHVIPRNAGDDITFAPPRRRLEPEDGDRIAGRLRDAIP